MLLTCDVTLTTPPNYQSDTTPPEKITGEGMWMDIIWLNYSHVTTTEKYNNLINIFFKAIHVNSSII